MQRLHYIDFMKGLCILFIVINHACPGMFAHWADNLNYALESFRIPMYYFISGIFFKLYDGMGDFVRRKVNNMLVPLAFFFVLACLVIALVRLVPPLQHIFMPLDVLVMNPNSVNLPLWFLVSLFEVNVIYYALQRYLPGRWWTMLSCLLLGVGGHALSTRGIELPLMLNTALLGIPYFALGSLMRHAGALKPHKLDYLGPVVLVAAMVCIYPLAQEIDLFNLHLPSLPYLYLVPPVSILSLLWACKRLPYIPGVCYVGRYSLVVLGTHFPLIRIIGNTLYLLNGNQWPPHTHQLTCLILIILEFGIIWLFIRVFPRFTAQKELFGPGWRLTH